MSGHFGAWTLKAVRSFMAQCCAREMHVEELPRGGYVAWDDLRSGYRWTGKTPAEAVRAMGVTLPADSCGY